MPSRALDFAGKPHSTVAWIERGLTEGFRTTIFSDGTYKDGVRVAELEAMGVDPDANVNDFDQSMSDAERCAAVRDMIG